MGAKQPVTLVLSNRRTTPSVCWPIIGILMHSRQHSMTSHQHCRVEAPHVWCCDHFPMQKPALQLKLKLVPVV